VAADEHQSELLRIRSMSRGALPLVPPPAADEAVDTLVAQYEAELYASSGAAGDEVRAPGKRKERRRARAAACCAPAPPSHHGHD
jgi:hypothetical protein